MAKLAANAYGDALFEHTLEKSKDNKMYSLHCWLIKTKVQSWRAFSLRQSVSWLNKYLNWFHRWFWCLILVCHCRLIWNPISRLLCTSESKQVHATYFLKGKSSIKREKLSQIVRLKRMHSVEYHYIWQFYRASQFSPR